MEGDCEDRGADAHGPVSMPGVYRDLERFVGPDSARTVVLEVDGETFAVREVADPASGHVDTGYDWVSGPNAGYGFGIIGPPGLSLEEHRQRIREFLAMVNPDTGYIAE